MAARPLRYDPAVSPGTVFRRSTLPDPPVAVEAHGSTIRDADGRDYLDAAGGAIVVNVGHGRAEIARGHGRPGGPPRLRPRQRLHHRAAGAYAAELGPYLPVDDPAIYPVSGGSEAIETALKLARAYHLASGEPRPLDRHRPLGELPRQHPRRARPVRAASRSAGPTRAWLGRFRHVSAAYPYRAGLPGLERARRRRGARRRARPRRSRPRDRARSPPSSPSRSSARRSRPSTRRTATGRRSPRSAGATASCSSPTR